MATIVNAGGGAVVTRLASLTNISKSSTAVSGTENWKEYDAIYFELFIHYESSSDISVFTNIIFSDSVSLRDRYQILRVSSSIGNGNNVNVFAYFSDTAISLLKSYGEYDITKVNIYGINL